MSTLLPTLSYRRFPRLDARLRDVGLVFGGMLFVAFAAQVKIWLPFTPVPITGQSFAVLLVGALLGSKRGALSLSLYLLSGGFGFPVFVGGNAGFSYLFGQTFGYLFGFAVAAYSVGKLAERGWERSWRTSLIPFFAGTVIIYLFGAGWLALFWGVEKAFLLGVFPFIFGDVLKLLLAAFLLPVFWREDVF
jgi:biotin transport system substrate-specific component